MTRPEKEEITAEPKAVLRSVLRSATNAATSTKEFLLMGMSYKQVKAHQERAFLQL